MRIAGQPASVTWAGLAPLLVGVYQVNVDIPPGAPPGMQALDLTIGGVGSNTAAVPIR